MSDTVYAIASGKGGVGKTTTAVNLGATLADRGNSVVVLDTDLGMANLAGFLDFEIEDPTLHEVLAGEADPEAGIYEAPGGIDVLPSSTDIEAFAKSDPANLQGVVADLREEYDYVLLDTGAGVSYDTLIPLALADSVLLVATPDVASVRDTAKTGELAARVGSDVAGAILTKRSSDILNADDVKETLGTDVLAVIPEDEAVPMGIDAGRPLSAFAPNAPAGRAYHDLAAILDGEAVPDPELGATESDDSEPETADVGSDVFDSPESESKVDSKSDSESELKSGSEPNLDSDSAPESDAESDVNEPADGTDATSADATSIADPLADSADSDPTDSDITDAEEAGSGDGWSEDPFADVDDASDDLDPLGAVTNEDSEAVGESGDSDEDTGDSNEDTDQAARSVDDLISQHIDKDRLDGDDPLASVEDSLDDGDDEAEDTDDETGADQPETPDSESDEVPDSESDEVPDSESDETPNVESDETVESTDSEDPLAVGGETEDDTAPETDDDSAEADSTAAESAPETDDDAAADLESETPDVGAVPFEGDGPSDEVSDVERDAQTLGDDSGEETVLADEAADEEDTSAVDEADEQDEKSEPESEDGANSGVLGRLGSLFK